MFKVMLMSFVMFVVVGVIVFAVWLATLPILY